MKRSRPAFYKQKRPKKGVEDPCKTGACQGVQRRINFLIEARKKTYRSFLKIIYMFF